MWAGPTTGPMNRWPRSYTSLPRCDAAILTSGRPGWNFFARSARQRTAAAAPSPIGHDIMAVRGQDTMRAWSTFSTVTGSVGWRWLIGLSAPAFQVFGAGGAGGSGPVDPPV